jgi:hypothetical protein
MQRQDSLCIIETGWADKNPKIESQTETERLADTEKGPETGQDSLCVRETGWADKNPKIESQTETGLTVCQRDRLVR